jgi:hypothetical protein
LKIWNSIERDENFDLTINSNLESTKINYGLEYLMKDFTIVSIGVDYELFKWNPHGLISVRNLHIEIPSQNLQCRDPNLRLMTRARAWKGVGQNCNPRVTFTIPRVQESVRE